MQKKKLLELCGVLGLKCDLRKNDLDSEIKNLIDQRDLAKKNKDWNLADHIRDKLFDMGIILEDTKDGTHWFHKRK